MSSKNPAQPPPLSTRREGPGLGVHEIGPSTAEHTPAVRRIALVGNPNSGKTTLFNQLTGLRQKVGNYPGVTVERHEGSMVGCAGVRVIDLPGCYSLDPRSLDERVARDVLMGWHVKESAPDAVIVVVDASNLERNLFLATQVLELNLPTLIACNMIDVVEGRAESMDVAGLAAELGVPVVATAASTGRGIEALRTAVRRLRTESGAATPGSYPRSRGWAASGRFDEAVREIGAVLDEGEAFDPRVREAVARLLVSGPGTGDAEGGGVPMPARLRARIQQVRDVRGLGRDWNAVAEATEARYRWLGELVARVTSRSAAARASWSDRIDHWACHRVWGLVIFSGLMAVMFLSVFSWAEPAMAGIEALVRQLGAGARAVLGQGALADLLVDGVIAGVGNVVVFFPQICILFLFIALLEDSGYMARAAFVMDRVMAGAGLAGKSFIPLLSSFACAVPAIMATRTIESRRDRLTTILVAPLMSCSARLPVYLVLISALFGPSIWVRSLILFSMYGLGLATALGVAMVLKRTLLKGPTPMFLLELPPYRRPQVWGTLWQMWQRSKVFLVQAGSIILALSVVLWALAYFPRGLGRHGGDPGAQLRQSYLGRIGQVLEPAIAPLGFDWKIGIGLAASFAAREVFVSTMGVVYGVGDDVDEESLSLREKLIAARWPDGRKVFTPLVGISLMVFYVLACQCMSTLAVVRRETNSWRWPAFMFAYMTGLAYVGSLVVYQGGRALGWG